MCIRDRSCPPGNDGSGSGGAQGPNLPTDESIIRVAGVSARCARELLGAELMPRSLTDRPLALSVAATVPESAGYRLKRRLLGPPLTTGQLTHQRLSNPLALGVLSSDCISSSAYGTEEMLLVLLPVFGMAAFTILLPLTGVILGVLILVTLSYRQVVMVYTRAGGSYIVARENFGSGVAQIAAVALMLDYIVTVAVQAAAGTAALVSASPALSPWNLEICLLYTSDAPTKRIV